jgi:hypothetical protein
MKLYQFTDASQFYDRVKDYLLQSEARHCLMLGILDNLINSPELYNKNPYLASVEIENKVVAVAVKTPPYKLVLSKISHWDALEAIAQDLVTNEVIIPGVTSIAEEARAFAAIWQNLTSRSYRSGMKLRIHQLKTLKPIDRSKGYLRRAGEGDVSLLVDWYEAFSLEAIGKIEINALRFVEHHLRHNTIYLWEDKIPVSMVCCSRSTPNGKCISYVYTPPEYRRKGYATSCVAALSQHFLDRGYRYCFLFTDVANPTSNHIYQTIGYQPVGDWNEYIFVEKVINCGEISS